MKNILVFVLGVVLLLGSYSCSTDLDINAPYEEITVVYGLLNLSDSIQYIKVNKAYLSENRSAFLDAQEPDSLYHPDALRVQLVPFVNFSSGNAIVCELDTVSKESGVFAGPNQLLYRIPKNTNLNPSATYKLEVIKTSTDEVIASSSTALVGDFNVTNPTVTAKVRLSRGNGIYNIFRLDWVVAENSELYEVEAKFSFIEKNKTSGAEAFKTVTWVITPGVSPTQSAGSTFKLGALDGKNFFETVAKKVQPNNNVDRILLNEMHLDFSVAEEQLATLIETSQPNTAVTQVKPQFSNIEGGVGIFSSRLTKRETRDMDDATINELISGEITGNLGFKKQ
jgi:hypothetical protein